MSVQASVCLALLAPVALLQAQNPDDTLATYRLGGEPAVVTRTDVALEMAFHLRRQERGRQGVELLVDALLTRRAAQQEGVMPSDDEVRRFWRDLQDQLRAAGHDPEEFAAVRNTGEAQWLRDLGVQLAQERLVRKELGLGAQERVSADMLKLWLAEERKKLEVVTDPDALPVGTAARVGTTSVPLVDLGFLLLRTAEDEERDKYVRQVAYLESIERLAQERAVEITPADLDLAVERRRRDAQQDPRLRGVSFENLLQAQGFTVSSLRALRVFRAHVLLDKLAEVEFPDAKLQAELAASRQDVLEEVGPRRRIGVIFVRALDDPNALVTRNFDQAQKHLEAVRARIATDGFAATASIESEDPETKQKGGDVGWHRRKDGRLPEVVAQAAFALDVADVSMPLRGEHGCYLVTVLDREPMPADGELMRRLRVVRGKELGERLLRDARLRMAGTTEGEAK